MSVFRRQFLLMVVGSIYLGVVSPVYADEIGFLVHGNVWQASYDGYVQSGGNRLDVEQDLNVDHDQAYQIGVAVEHPIPAIPNVALRYNQITTESTGTLNTNFNGVQFSGATDVELDLSHLQGLVYYQLLDNWVNLDLGLELRMMQGGATASTQGNASNRTELDLDVVFPLVYAAVQADLPFSGFSVGLQGSGIAFDGSQLTDLELYARYETSLGIGGQLGWRQLAVELDDIDDLNADLELNGVVLSAFYHF